MLPPPRGTGLEEKVIPHSLQFVVPIDGVKVIRPVFLAAGLLDTNQLGARHATPWRASANPLPSPQIPRDPGRRDWGGVENRGRYQCFHCQAA